MYNESDYLNISTLYDIDSKVEEVYKKYESILSKTYTPKESWNDGSLLYVQDIKKIEDAIEYIGNMFGYPTGWITSRTWSLTSLNTISSTDINRMYNNLDVLLNSDFVPLMPNNALYPRDSYIYPNTNEYPNTTLYSNPLIPSNNTKESD